MLSKKEWKSIHKKLYLMVLHLQGFKSVMVNMKLEPLTVSTAPYPQMKCSVKNKKARMESIHN
jgi:hypothetical protein